MVSFSSTHLGADFVDPHAYSLFLRETMWELAEAQYIVDIILRYNRIKILPLQPTQRHGWDMPEVKGLWYDPGEETIVVPDLSERYNF